MLTPWWLPNTGIEGHIAGRLNDTSCKRLDSLLVELIDGHLSRFVWLRKIEPGKNSADINRLLDRLRISYKTLACRQAFQPIFLRIVSHV